MKGILSKNSTLATVAFTLAISTVPAQAGSDILIRQLAPSFDVCVAVQDNMMRNLGVEPHALLTTMDTGAVLERTYASSAADLVLVCNRVTDVLEVRRVTPGTPPKAASASPAEDGSAERDAL